MADNLVIVESPAKAKTINKYLGDDFIVKASMGHVRDLPSKGMGVDLKTFQPDYEVLESRSKVIGELRKLAKESDKIYLATDLDREGEAIAWHLKETLGIPDERAYRGWREMFEGERGRADRAESLLTTGMRKCAVCDGASSAAAREVRSGSPIASQREWMACSP